MLYRWIHDGKPIYPGIVLVSLIDCFGPTYFWWPRTKDKSVLIAHHEKFTRYIGSNELVSITKMWNFLMARVRGLYAQYDHILNHCRHHALNHKKIREVLATIRQCVDVCYAGLDDEKRISELKSFDEEEMVESSDSLFSDMLL